MNAGAIRQTLKSLDLIPPQVATDIERTGSRKDANNCLLQYMKEDADEKRVQGILEIASKAESFGIMNIFATGILRNQQ